jgi:hypothetical protein
MELAGLKLKRGFSATMAALGMAFLLTAAIPVHQAYGDNESITVSCFKGNSEEGNYIGEISVNRLRDATSDCNREFEGCQGGCIGCVVDAQNNQVCYDINGEKVSQ